MRLESDMNTNIDHYKHLLDTEIPLQRRSLKDNVKNLEKVAQYCEDVYVDSKDLDKINLLNETKKFTTQSLASIAYQINTLANSFLNVLDNQMIVIDDMTLKTKQLTQQVNNHNEKVARREIGALTTTKNITRTVKVKKPELDEKQVKYIRKPIDYTILDDIGHGVKINKPEFKIGRQNSYSSTHSSGSDIRGAPTMKPPTPPLLLKSAVNASNNQSGGTVRSTTSYYRTPVVPPSVPSEYLSRQELGIYSSKKELNLSDAAGYGGPTGSVGGYRRPSQTSNEYSGMDTIDRRFANSYLQQLNNSSNNNSVGYASGKDIGIRTNINNIDYATNGTLHRRPQLPNSRIYTRSGSLQTGDNGSVYGTTATSNSGSRISQLKAESTPRSNSLTASMIPASQINFNNELGLPEPPAEFFNEMQQQQQSSMIDTNDMHSIENQQNEDNVLYVGSDNIDDIENDIPDFLLSRNIIEKVITTYDYTSQRSDELSFKENQFIYITIKNDDQWHQGIMKDMETGRIISGLFPYNYARCVRKYNLQEDSRVSEC